MIPTLDWQRFASRTDIQGFVHDLGSAMQTPGIFLLKNHGIPAAQIATVFKTADGVFHLTEAEKRTLSRAVNGHNRGWAGFGDEKLDHSTPTPDRKESFNIGVDLPSTDPRVAAGEPFRGITPWPNLPGFREVMLDYLDSVMSLGLALHEAIAQDLGVSHGIFKRAFKDPAATLRLLAYPAALGSDPEIGAGAHTDYGSLSIGATDGQPGLQFLSSEGHWHDVPSVPDTLVITIGDCLMRWSNGRYRSTLHRVLPPPQRRQSLVLYMDPDPEAIIAPLPAAGTPRYQPVVYGDYLTGRLRDSHLPRVR